MTNKIATISKTKEILKKYSFLIKKSYGQNFLIDTNITKNIVQKSAVNKNTSVLEIGPGIGSLSEELAINAKKVVSIEIDTQLEEVLKETLLPYENSKIIFEDFLKLDLKKLFDNEFKDEKDIVVVANLPYYITTPILIKLFENLEVFPISKIVVMVQKEVGERLSAKKDTKDYNSLSILVQYYSIPKIIMNISKNVFIPAPNIDSVVVSFDILKERKSIDNEKLFFEILRVLFKQRRKTILNNLNEYINDKEKTKAILEKLGFNPKLRAENLSIDDIILLVNMLNKEG